jgi:hypothetical protein
MLARGVEHTPSRPSAPQTAAYTAATSSTHVPKTAGQSRDEAYLTNEAVRCKKMYTKEYANFARYETVATDAAVAGFESNNLTVRSRQPYTPSCVAAKGNADYGISDSCRAAAAAAAGNFSGITWILANWTFQKSKEHIKILLTPPPPPPPPPHLFYSERTSPFRTRP